MLKYYNMEKVSQKVIEVKKVSKSFRTNFQKGILALSHLVNIKENFGIKSNSFEALKEVSFDVEKGEVLGIIGKNGSGKSTLLRILAEVYKPSVGEVVSKGSVFYLTAAGIGLMEKLTMKDNIFLVGSVMGLSQKRIREIYDEIVDFSELKDFVNLKIKQFSAGMIGRLGFSISVFCMKNKDVDILLLDEVFGSGVDYEFENKAIAKMEELITGGATVVMVSHDLELMKKYCSRIIWLDNGAIREDGLPDSIIEKYKRD